MRYALLALLLFSAGCQKRSDQKRSETIQSPDSVLAAELAEALRQGDANLDRGNFDLAIAAYSAAIKINPQSGDAYLNRAIAYREVHRLTEAADDCTKAVLFLREDAKARAYYVKGRVWMDRHNPVMAITNYSVAIQIDRTSADVFLSRGSAYMVLGETGKAIADYTRAIEIDPKFANAYYCRSIAYDKQENNSLAEADRNLAISLGDDSENREKVEKGEKGSR